ncbi:splicing factor ESS-2 homolog [Uloborus diversus]|uniref:splicing factor ESS-2 homolog n=1 Tax=Uloborus diversus TaxID=327109 RepID=UPI002409DE38|nr:splicing factor ESS-2 homolog [Uloborus diversus]
MSITPISTVCLIDDTNEKKNVTTKKILSEEEYTEKLDKIITRDFFPDVPKLKAQNEYLSALEKGDIAKIQEIQLAYQPSQSRVNSVRTVASTPAGFETPDVSSAASPLRSETETSRADSIASEKKPVSLDQFLAQSTSEDNASFQIIMEKSALVHQQKYPWLYKDENEEQNKLTKMLALPSAESDTIKEEKPELVTWAYKNQNSLMYVPPGADFTIEEKLSYGNRKEISHNNTRFEAPPFDEEANKEAIAEAASVQAKMKEGKVGIDGKEIIPGDSPQVNGYGFVGTPVPDPGITDTPIMTWGEIEGTPFRLDGSDTPLPQNPGGQQFKIPNLSARERIALSLADKVAKKHRKKTNTTLLSPLHMGSYSPATPMEKLQNMSPAARKLACAKLGIQQNTDKALRASYSPSPSPLRTPNANKTPVIQRSPVVSPAIKTLIKPSDADTMLNLPKRHKASDFF